MGIPPCARPPGWPVRPVKRTFGSAIPGGARGRQARRTLRADPARYNGRLNQLTAIQNGLRLFTRAMRPLALRPAGKEGSTTPVVRHAGRRPGRTYQTPVIAVLYDGSFVIALPYGGRTDWLKNVLSQGPAALCDQWPRLRGRPAPGNPHGRGDRLLRATGAAHAPAVPCEHRTPGPSAAGNSPNSTGGQMMPSSGTRLGHGTRGQVW